jgi:hypothetical protein
MPVERVIDPVGRRVRLVISNTKFAAGAQQLEQRLRQPPIRPGQYTDMPGSLFFPIHRREAVDGHDLGRGISGHAVFDNCVERAVVRLINRLNAARAIFRRDFVVTRNHGVLADRYHRAVMSRVTIHVQDETGHRGMDQRRVQQTGESACELESAGVPCDVAIQLSGRQAQAP